ncbi:MAG TPA: ribonuclease P protein component [Alphaproteobacteria bacterium]|nr:ribonuclease P protein component [Alphaproteobacteria bacterium]
MQQLSEIDTLRKRADFLAIAKTGQRGIAQSVTLQYRPAAPEQKIIRVGFTATKKLGNAVVRNRAKRRLRAAILEVLKEKPITPCDMVLIAREGLAARDFPTLLQDLRYCLRKAGAAHA